jgi:hypothetical protein
MKQWLGEEQMNIEVNTSWKLGTPIYISGFHHVQFEVRGRIVEFKFPAKLSYTHLSSVSNLPDAACNYTTIEFFLTPVTEGVELKVQLNNFPTESIYKHLHFYWMTTLTNIKMIAESTAG